MELENFNNYSNYHAVAFIHSEINKTSDLNKYFDKATLSIAEEVKFGEEDKFEISHYVYSRAKSFYRNAEQDQTFKDGKYHYSFFLISFDVNGKNIYLIAVPWVKMGVELFKGLAPKSFEATETSYVKTSLLDLINSLKGEGRDDNLNLLNSNFSIDEDTNIKTVELSGEYPLYSAIFEEIDKLVSFKPNRCKVAYVHDDSKKFILSIDKSGCMSFRIGANLEKLTVLASIFEVFSRRELLNNISYNPFRLKAKVKERDE